MAKPISLFTKNIYLSLCLLVVSAGLFVFYARAEKQIDRANELRIQTQLLAEELQRSSDDLTQMVRAYVVTGNPIHKKHYLEILSIRDGKSPRPIDYHNIYWGVVSSNDKRPTEHSNQTIPLLTLLKHSGVRDNEFALLAQAKANSDALTRTEFAAMQLVESAQPTTEAVRTSASRLLHDEAYDQAKKAIMQPLRAFREIIDKRTTDAVRQAEAEALLLRAIFVLIGLLLVIMLWRTYRSLNSILGGTIDEVHNYIIKIGSGDLSEAHAPASKNPNSILSWLSQTHTNLTILSKKNHRLTYLHAALSQCNQSIARCVSEAELFPEICRDAVHFGGIKMAWIGLIDPATQRITPKASSGEGIDYLQNIELSSNEHNLFGCGPAGTAIRDNCPVWCQDFINDPSTAPWHEQGLQYQWGSSAALPIHKNGRVTGVFVIYFDEPHAFDESCQTLLIEMADDIDFAIDRIALTDQLKKVRERKDSIVNNIDQAIWSVDVTTNQVLFVNAATEIVYGHPVSDFLEKPNFWIQTIHPDDVDTALAHDNEARTNGKSMAEYRIIRSNGEVRWVCDHAWRVRDEGGLTARLDGITSDITERKSAEESIRRLAYYDELTGLPNRALLSDRVNQALSMTIRNHGSLAIMFLDLDHFKNINDSLGHAIGDQVLIQTAQRMRVLVHEEDTVARPGGDEFILVLLDTNADGAAHVAEKILASLSEPYLIDGQHFVITSSIGIAMHPEDGEDFQSLSQCADTAMYRAKREGRNSYRFFSLDMQAQSARSLFLENALREALEKDQLRMHYQPQFSIDNAIIVGAEALIRWNHPELGWVSPAEFIPIAESSGQIIAIGEWSLRTALSAYKNWCAAGVAPETISVNLSAKQFMNARLADSVAEALRDFGVAPHHLELELTEGVAMDDPMAAIKIMDDLHAQGIRLSVDDFGTGYSSLSYLKRFKIHKLKIDQSFVRDITNDQDDRAIIIAIINLSRSLGFQTIAEGVETKEQWAFLLANDCNEVQGYHFSKPLPEDQFVAFCQQHGR